jgi:hypothetical protein
VSSFCAMQKPVQRSSTYQPPCSFSLVAETRSTMPARSACCAHECCNLEIYEPLPHPLVAKPTQVMTRACCSLGPREFSCGICTQTNQCAANALDRNSAEFRAYFPRKYPQSSHVDWLARRSRRASDKSGMNLALACPKNLRALKLSSGVMHRMPVSDRKD